MPWNNSLSDFTSQSATTIKVHLEANMRSISKDFCQKLHETIDEDYICQLSVTKFTNESSTITAHFRVIASKPCPSRITLANLQEDKAKILRDISKDYSKTIEPTDEITTIDIKQCKYLVDIQYA